MKDQTKEYYEKNALKWIKIKSNPFFKEKQFKIFEKLLKKGDRVIDMGCAGGVHVPLFLGIGNKLKYEGFDFSKAMIKIAKSHYPQLSFNVKNVLNFKSKKKFNAFWASAILMHLPRGKWPKLLENIESNMKKKAIGYVSLPEDRPGPKSKKDPRHFELFNKKTFKEIIEKRNWKILKTGKLPQSRGTTNWNWFIVRLP